MTTNEGKVGKIIVLDDGEDFKSKINIFKTLREFTKILHKEYEIFALNNLGKINFDHCDILFGINKSLMGKTAKIKADHPDIFVINFNDPLYDCQKNEINYEHYDLILDIDNTISDMGEISDKVFKGFPKKTLENWDLHRHKIRMTDNPFLNMALFKNENKIVFISIGIDAKNMQTPYNMLLCTKLPQLIERIPGDYRIFLKVGGNVSQELYKELFYKLYERTYLNGDNSIFYNSTKGQMFETKYLDSMQKISDPSKAVLSVSDLIISTDDNMEFIINATAAEKPIIAIDSELNRESRSKESKDFISRLFNYNIDYLNLENLGDFDNIIEHQSPAIPYDNIKENAQSIALEYCLHKARDDYIRTLTNDANTNAKEEY
jgi:hypothetical protein